jgi:hypothetical protein
MSTSSLVASTSIIPASNFAFLGRTAPAVFATSPSPKVTSRYRFYNTAHILAALAEAGFQPTQATQARTRDMAARDYARHMIRLRIPNEGLVVGDVYPEIVVVNSHGGSCRLSLAKGLHRCACTNGLMTPVGEFGRIVVPHRASIITDVVDAARQMAGDFSSVMADVRSMMDYELSDEERFAFAAKAAEIRYGDNPVPFPIARILEPKRHADIGRSLWLALNTAQEHLMRGHVRYMRDNGRYMHTRKITSITEDIRINSGLWELAMNYLPTQTTSS